MRRLRGFGDARGDRLDGRRVAAVSVSPIGPRLGPVPAAAPTRLGVAVRARVQGTPARALVARPALARPVETRPVLARPALAGPVVSSVVVAGIPTRRALLPGPVRAVGRIPTTRRGPPVTAAACTAFPVVPRSVVAPPVAAEFGAPVTDSLPEALRPAVLTIPVASPVVAPAATSISVVAPVPVVPVARHPRRVIAIPRFTPGPIAGPIVASPTTGIVALWPTRTGSAVLAVATRPATVAAGALVAVLGATRGRAVGVR